jgi:hypothetical protein
VTAEDCPGRDEFCSLDESVVMRRDVSPGDDRGEKGERGAGRGEKVWEEKCRDEEEN